MHILIASPYLPWPLIDGGRVAQYRTFEALRDVCTFTLVVPVPNAEEEVNARDFGKIFPHVRVETVPCFRPQPPLIERAVRKLVRQVFAAPNGSSAASGQKTEALPFYPFECLSADFVAMVEKQFARGCDIFQAEFAEMMSLGPLMAGRVPTVFVHLQLHFVYARRFMEANGNRGYGRYLTERMAREEAAFLKAFDSVIVLSEVDREALANFCPELQVQASPCPSPEEVPAKPRSFTGVAKRFVFVASESHKPNVDGLQWFMKDVWPGIKRQLPGAAIEVIGKWSPTAQMNLANHEDVVFAGFVPELTKALENKIMVVPVWIGSGIRTKILAAWSSSCPVVTTTIGVEGLPGQAGEHFIVADEAAGFASACVDLAENVTKLNRIAANALELVQNNYSLAAVRRTRMEIYERLLAARELK
jgi:glycosyltransferase involved in cell wall biosynthesis